MAGIESTGLTSEAFAKRIESCGNVVEHWPFKDLPDEPAFTKAYFPKAITVYSNTNQPIIAIGTVLKHNDNAITLHVKDNPIVLNIPMDDQEIKAWEQLIGIPVTVLLQLGLGDFRSRDASIEKVLGINQPLYPPLADGTYQNKRAGRTRGFVQGIVLEETRPSHYFRTTLNVGEKGQKATLIGNYPWFNTALLHSPRNYLTAGDTIRAHVLRDTTEPNTFRQTDHAPTVYIMHSET